MDTEEIIDRITPVLREMHKDGKKMPDAAFEATLLHMTIGSVRKRLGKKFFSDDVLEQTEQYSAGLIIAMLRDEPEPAPPIDPQVVKCLRSCRSFHELRQRVMRRAQLPRNASNVRSIWDRELKQLLTSE